VDYRKLNNIILKDRYFLFLISETLNRLSGVKIFFKFDFRDTYYRIKIRKGDEWKTTFRIRYGYYEYVIMPFGFANAPAIFQVYINKVLIGLVNIYCIVYLDDIFIYFKDKREHERHIRVIFKRLRRYKFYAKRSKYIFYIVFIEFLSFIVSIEGVSINLSKIDFIFTWLVLKSFRNV
jgi:hypothetical protein